MNWNRGARLDEARKLTHIDRPERLRLRMWPRAFCCPPPSPGNNNQESINKRKTVGWITNTDPAGTTQPTMGLDSDAAQEADSFLICIAWKYQTPLKRGFISKINQSVSQSIWQFIHPSINPTKVWMRDWFFKINYLKGLQEQDKVVNMCHHCHHEKNMRLLWDRGSSSEHFKMRSKMFKAWF